MLLQEIMIDLTMVEIIHHMYYRSSEDIVKNEDNYYVLRKNNYIDFFTYFNALSVEKWMKYTYAKKFYLTLDIQGKFDVLLFGHYKSNNNYFKEWLGKYEFDISERKKVRIPYPIAMRSSVAAFLIETKKNSILYNAYYEADIEAEKIQNIFIALTTTTYKKEEYIERNINLLEEKIFADKEYTEHFCWNIIDNGRTLEKRLSEDAKIRIIPNKNVGGAGGFARGMMEGLIQKKTPTHILLMDDDVVFSVESFKRLYVFLSIVKEKYKDCFVSGAMLKMGEPNIQHEDLGYLNPNGYHEAVKPNFDLNLWNCVLENEIFHTDKENLYAAWWFCCIPTTIARLDNLPMPVFVRGDDVEYSIRNKAEFITMNGICIWHEGFENKFSAALEFYQVNRNELIVQALNAHIENVDFIGHIKQIFWEEIYKYNYKGAALILDAVEDFLKGPEYIMSLDGEQCMKDKKAEDNQLTDIVEKVQKYIKTETLYQYDVIGGVRLFLYNHTCNGQKRVPEFFSGKGTGVIPYGWGYDKGKLADNRIIYAVDLQNRKYATFVRSRKRFKELTQRYEWLMQRFEQEKREISLQYTGYYEKMTDKAFWREYLGME